MPEQTPQRKILTWRALRSVFQVLDRKVSIKITGKEKRSPFDSMKEKVKHKCRDPGLNRGPLDLQSNALPTELSRQVIHLNEFNKNKNYKVVDDIVVRYDNAAYFSLFFLQQQHKAYKIHFCLK